MVYATTYVATKKVRTGDALPAVTLDGQRSDGSGGAIVLSVMFGFLYAGLATGAVYGRARFDDGI
jgi:hypothetical protein